MLRDELRKNGFPPGFLTEEGETSSQTNSFLRIGSIDLSGNITACIKSRPLKKELAEIKFELDAFDPLDREIRNQSMENLATLGRRGCNTDELYSLVQAYFMKIFRQILSETLEDLSKGGTDTAKEVDRAINWTKDSLKKYVGDAGGWTGEQIQGKVAGRLEKWGKSVENLSDTHKSVLELARRIQQKTFKDSNDEATSPT